MNSPNSQLSTADSGLSLPFWGLTTQKIKERRLFYTCGPRIDRYPCALYLFMFVITFDFVHGSMALISHLQ